MTGVPSDRDYRQDSALLDVERATVLAGMLDHEVPEEAGRWPDGDGESEQQAQDVGSKVDGGTGRRS